MSAFEKGTASFTPDIDNPTLTVVAVRMTRTGGSTSPSGGSLKLLDFRALGAPHLASDVRGTPLLGKHRGTLLRLDNDTGRGCAIGGCRCLCSWTLHLVSQLAVADETGMKAPTLFTIMNMHRAPRDALLNSMRRTGATRRFWHHMTAALQKFGESPFCALG